MATSKKILPQAGEPTPTPTPNPALQPPLSSHLVITAPALGPEQQLFNQLLAKIEKQSCDLENLKAMADAHAAQRMAKLAPLRQQVYALQEDMVMLLDARLQAPKGLSLRAQRDLLEVMTFLLESLLDSGQPSAPLQALAERYFGQDGDGEDTQEGTSAEEFSQRNQATAKALGLDVDADEHLSEDDFIEALMRKMQADEACAQQAHEARQAKRKKSAKQKQAEDEQLDAHSALRTIYRKLASALHPDRESNPAERVRKNALMVRVNAANDRKDLLSLLRLQLEIDQIDPSSVAAMAQDKLRGINRMLKSQLKDLQTEYREVTGHIHMAFELGFGDVNAKSLLNALRHQTQRLHNVIEVLTHDLVQVQDDKALKKWVKAQISALDGVDYY